MEHYSEGNPGLLSGANLHVPAPTHERNTGRPTAVARDLAEVPALLPAFVLGRDRPCLATVQKVEGFAPSYAPAPREGTD